DDGHALMPQPAQRRGFALEQLVRLPLRDRGGVERLERDEPILRPIAREKGLRERAASERTNDLVAVRDQPIAAGRSGSFRSVHGGRRLAFARMYGAGLTGFQGVDSLHAACRVSTPSR